MTDTRPTLDLDLVWKAGLHPRKSVEPELFALLDAIKNTGKLTEATEQVGMPYRQAWGLIAAWSERMLVTKEQGRGTQLTVLGERLVWVREHINARLTPHLESAASEVEQELSEILDEPNPSTAWSRSARAAANSPASTFRKAHYAGKSCVNTSRG